YLLENFTTDFGRGDISLSPDSEKALKAYPWPGNIRELRNVLERAVLLSEQNVLSPRDLHFDSPSTADAAFGDSSLTLIELEQKYIERVLQEERGQVDQAARRLGIPRSSLYQKIKKYGIPLSRA
ncbi:MAG: sigma-54-dependent Fis family transcriptional regulator, partial [Acidobacteriota bacterium]|nr:sigma-54-dependent Fis family transcriptional regulator [Acidobacteriota bacterium]